MFGAKRRLARELAHEMLRPIGGRDNTEEASKANVDAYCLKLVRDGKADAAYDSQKGWKKGEG